MFPPARNQVPPGFGFGPPPQSPASFGGTPFGGFQGFGPTQRAPRQGLLSRLKQRRQTGNAFQGFRGFQGLQGAQGLQGGSNIANALGNMQQVLQVAQTATPMIQQYAPMIRNLPMMINLWKIMREPDEEEENSSNETADNVESSTQLHSAEIQESSSLQAAKPIKRKVQGASQPKLFI
jgi:hypothetical protein